MTDVSWNYRVKKQIKPFKPRTPDAPDGTWRMAQEDVDRVQEFRKCIECFLCQDVCHVLRDHHKHDEFIGPRFLVYTAALEMHPLDTDDRVPELQEDARHRLLQHHQVLHQGLPRAHHHHRQRHHPAEGAGGGRFYDPVARLLRKLKPNERAGGGIDSRKSHHRCGVPPRAAARTARTVRSARKSRKREPFSNSRFLTFLAAIVLKPVIAGRHIRSRSSDRPSSPRPGGLA